VSQKDSNELGLHDMSGNVWEWCWDLNTPDRRIRGASWNSYPDFYTVAHRDNYDYPDSRNFSIGFRLARNLD
jgi:formylglycine-generating enzyme required for sulfatase activity